MQVKGAVDEIPVGFIPFAGKVWPSPSAGRVICPSDSVCYE
jgi:hypothetical protein